MRVAVLPREIASSVITGAVSRMAWAYGALSIVVDIPTLVETLSRAGHADRIALPLVLLVAQLVALVVAGVIARPWVVVGYLLLGAVLCCCFQLAVIDALPNAVSDHVFLLNRPAIALLTIGVTATSTVAGIAWTALGFGVSLVTIGVASAIARVPFVPGYGPFLLFGAAIAAYAGFALVQRRSRARVPNVDALEAETQALVDGVNLTRRTTAVVHDTVLNDLAIVMNGPDRLDERTRNRLRDDLTTLTGAEWLATARDLRPPDEQDVHVRNAIGAIISDLQWRGLTVQLSGVGDGINRLDPVLVEAMIDGIRAALENVLRHSGARSAEVAFAQDDSSVSVMVVDQGAGFDQSAIPTDRLGVRESIVRRVSEAGGSVRIWSSPGAGTSVVMTGAIDEVVLPSPPSRHRERAPRSERPERSGGTDG